MARQILKGLTMLMAIVALAFVSAVATANGQTGNEVRAQIPQRCVPACHHLRL